MPDDTYQIMNCEWCGRDFTAIDRERFCGLDCARHEAYFRQDQEWFDIKNVADHDEPII